MPLFTVEKLRRAKKTIYIVACMYIVVGLLLAVTAALAGDRLSAFLGFLIITGALACGAVLVVLLRFGVHLSNIGDQLQQLHNQLIKVQHIQRQFNSAVVGEAPQKSLTKPGKQDQQVDEVLVAATLDRSRFPRLAKIMDSEPSGQSSADGVSSKETTSTNGRRHDVEVKTPVSKRTLIKLPRTWQTAHREGDIVACRAMLSTYMDTAEPAAVEVMTVQLEQLIDQAAAHLRQSFVGHIHNEDYAGALAVGHRIVELMPEHGLAEEFKQIKPHLNERVRQIEQTAALM